MSTLTYRYYTLRTVIPKRGDASAELKKLADRDVDLTGIGEDGCDLVSTITLNQSDDVTLIVDTFKRPEL